MSLVMSVSGIRGIVGETLTPQLAVDIACAFGSHIGPGTIVVGRDSRPSGPMVQAAVTSGLLACGCRVVELGVVTTPGTALMVSELRADGGIMITASHNPLPWNGIKFLTRDGHAPFVSEAERILHRYRERSFRLADVERVGSMDHDSGTAERHIRRVLATIDAAQIRSRKFTVVLDSVHGAGGPSGRALLEALGCRVVHLYGEPTGLFPHTPEPTRENLTELCGVVAARNADIGFAQDPDADRLAVVDEKGGYIGEEYTLALAARQILKHRPGPVAANLSTSRMIDDVAGRMGAVCVVHRSATGEANVVEVMKAHGCVLGGEGNGGVIDPRVGYVRDSLAAMALTLQLLADEARPLSAIVADIPAYSIVKHKFECDSGRADRILAKVREAFRDQRVNETDGLRIDWPEGWVQIRRSNTEPIVRIISEASSEAAARALVSRVEQIAVRV